MTMSRSLRYHMNIVNKFLKNRTSGSKIYVLASVEFSIRYI